MDDAPREPNRPAAQVELLGYEDAIAFAHHLREHLRDNGAHGLVFSPIEPHEMQVTAVDVQRRAHALARGMVRSLDRLDWRRVFVVRDPELGPADRARRLDRGIVGHLDLRGGVMPAELHRCQLAMGLYAGFRGRGLGRLLLDAALGWARQQPSLAWVDLGVFSHNGPAQHLYRSAGFVEDGRVVDRFRVQGASVDEVHMALRLRF